MQYALVQIKHHRFKPTQLIGRTCMAIGQHRAGIPAFFNMQDQSKLVFDQFAVVLVTEVKNCCVNVVFVRPAVPRMTDLVTDDRVQEFVKNWMRRS